MKLYNVSYWPVWAVDRTSTVTVQAGSPDEARQLAYKHLHAIAIVNVRAIT